jgi:hypothetical protein
MHKQVLSLKVVCVISLLLYVHIWLIFAKQQETCEQLMRIIFVDAFNTREPS